MEFKTNAGGDLTKHLLNAHNMTLENYVILTEYDNINPICECGFCLDRPEFYRGKFKKYAYGHTSAEWYQKNYIIKYGHPICEECGNMVEFRTGRKVFPRFCSTKCSGTHNKDTIISKMRPKIIDRFAYSNEYKDKIRTSMKLKFTDPVYAEAHKQRQIKSSQNPLTKKKHSVNSINNWKRPEYRNKTIASLIKKFNEPSIRKHRSEIALKLRENPIIRDKYNQAFLKCARQSKLHIKWRNLLNLDSYGFISEVPIGNYIVDELNEELKLIIEINGNHPHANPIKYKADDLIQLGNHVQYYAYEKWEKDRKRQEKLESLGYTVFVIWESDNLDDIKEKLHILLNNVT